MTSASKTGADTTFSLDVFEDSLSSAAARLWFSWLALLLFAAPLVLFLAAGGPVSPNGARRFIASKIRRINPSANADRIAGSIVSESLQRGIDPFVVASMIHHESAFRPHAVSSKGAVGLMQILPSTARYISAKRGITWHGYERLTDPEYNIALGVAYVSYLWERFEGDSAAVVMAYNWGPERVLRLQHTGSRPIAEVARYTRRVLETHRSWRSECRSQAL